jgi:hypothetical protein
MYDNQIAEVLKQTYGDENFRIYCEMQVMRNKLANDELQKLNGEVSDVAYESYFWQQKLEELSKK